MKSTVKISVSIIVLLILLGVGIGLTAYFTHGFDFSDLSGVESPGDTSDPDDPDAPELPSGDNWLAAIGDVALDSESILPENAELQIHVNADEFTVEVLPGNATFDFRHNGALVKFPYIDGNFNEAFEINVADGSFTINTAKRSMMKILESFYPGEEITDMTALNGTIAYFVLRISGNGETVEIPLTGFYESLKIELDKTEIIF